jgi:hypothetical protein
MRAIARPHAMRSFPEVTYGNTLPILMFPAVATTSTAMTRGTYGRAGMVGRSCVVLICCGCVILSGSDSPMLRRYAASVIVLVAVCIGSTRGMRMLILHVPAEFPSVLFVGTVPVARMFVPIRRMKPFRMSAVVLANPSRIWLRPFRMMSIEPAWVALAPPSRFPPDVATVVRSVIPYRVSSPVRRLEPFRMTAMVGVPPFPTFDRPFRMVSINPLRMIRMPIFRVAPSAVRILQPILGVC